ncbi:MAG: glutamate--tRNA ligase, partial [Acidobacteria bacterium]|nr:glutamate--tRNA ligase [Acidobacteriota bacterium]
LDWFNSRYLRSMPLDKLRELAVADLKASGVWSETAAVAPDVLASVDAALELVRPRTRKTGDFSGNFRAFFTDDFSYDSEAAAKFLSDPGLKELMPALLEKYAASDEFTLQSTEADLRCLAERSGIKAGLLINALRVALTGQGVAPGLFEVTQVLGRERALARMRRLCDYLRNEGEL